MVLVVLAIFISLVIPMFLYYLYKYCCVGEWAYQLALGCLVLEVLFLFSALG